MHVVGGHDVDARPHGQFDQCIVSGAVERTTMVPEFDRDVRPTESTDQRVEHTTGGRRTFPFERPRDRALPATGEDLPVGFFARHEPLVER